MAEFEVRHILVACDTDSEPASAIETAVRLAAKLDATLHGVFVEDQRLLHVAAFPFARQVNLSTGSSEELDTESVEKHFQRLSGQARDALKAAARRHGVDWTFSTVRAHRSAASLLREPSDLLIVSARTRPISGDWRPTSRLIELLYGITAPVLMLRGGSAEQGPVIALIETAFAEAKRLLNAGALLASASGRLLQIQISTELCREQDVRAWLYEFSPALIPRSRIQRTVSTDAADLRIADDALVVIDANPRVNDERRLRELAAKTRADLLLVR